MFKNFTILDSQFLGGSQDHTSKLRSSAKALGFGDLDELLNFDIILKLLK